MSQEKETFTSEELAAWRKVNRIKAEINAELEAEGHGSPEPEKKKSIFDDPADNPNEPHNEYHRTKQAHLNKKMNYTDDQKAFAKQIVKNMRY